MPVLLSPENILGFVCLVFLLVVLSATPLSSLADATGIPERKRTMLWVLSCACLRIGLLGVLLRLAIPHIPLFSLRDDSVTVRELLYVALGAYLLGRSAIGMNRQPGNTFQRATNIVTPGATIISVIPHAADGAVLSLGMSDEPAVMVAAVICAAVITYFSRRSLVRMAEIYRGVNRLAFASCMLASLLLIVEGIAGGLIISKTYLYFAVAFAYGVLLLGIGRRRKLM